MKPVDKFLIGVAMVILLLLTATIFYAIKSNSLQNRIEKYETRIENNNKTIDSLKVVISLSEVQISEEKLYSESLENDLKLMKLDNNKITKRYENLKNKYTSLSNDDKWSFFWTTINK